MSEVGTEYPTAQSFAPYRPMEVPSDLSVFDMTPEEDYDDDLESEFNTSAADEITAHEEAEEADEVPAAPQPEPLRIPLTGAVSAEQTEPEAEQKPPVPVKPAAAAEPELPAASAATPLDAEPSAADNERRPGDAGQDAASRGPAGGLATIEPIPKPEPAAEASDRPAASADAAPQAVKPEAQPGQARQYDFRGPNNTPMARYETIDRYNRMSRQPFKGEAPKTDADKQFMADYDRASAIVAKEVGTPAPAETDSARIHLFNSKGEYLAGIADRWGAKEAERRVSTQGFNFPGTGVVWTRSGNTAHDEYGMGHEMEHDSSLAVVNTKPPAYDIVGGQIEAIHVKETHVGYSDLPTTLPPGEPHGLTEMVTDMSINKKLELMGRPPIVPDYRPLDLLGSALVRKVAEAHDDLTPAAVENGLIRGMRTTDRSMLEKVRAVVGDEGLDTVVNMKAHLFGKEAIAIARQLGLDTTELETYDAGRPVRYFDWQRARPTQD